MLIATLAELDGEGIPHVGMAGTGSVPARSTVALRTSDLGRDVAVMCEAGDRTRPIIIGVIQPPSPPTAEVTVSPGALQVEADGERVEVNAQRELVLRCGEASITLTRAGKILLRGTYLLSRSSGVNRIKGGSVQIN